MYKERADRSGSVGRERKMATDFGAGEKLLFAFFLVYLLFRFLGGYFAGTIFVLGLTYLIYDFYQKSKLWTRLGVPQPSTKIFIGNMMDYAKKGTHVCDIEWSRKYGSMYGSYMFTTAELSITDKELLKQVLVKDFYNFTNRRFFIFSSDKSIMRKLLNMLRDDEWKNTRNKITPAFTSGKLKGTIDLMGKGIQTCSDILAESGNVDDGIDIKNLTCNLSLDIIAAVAFGLDCDSQRHPDNEFAKYANQFTSDFSTKNWKLYFTLLFPWISAKLDEYFGIQMLFAGIEQFYVTQLTKILEERRKHPKTDEVDFLQLLVNAANTEDDQSTVDKAMTTTTGKNYKFTDLDIITQSFTFLVASQETTSNTLVFAFYLLAVHPEAQEKCYREIMQAAPEGEKVTYKTVQNDTPYLEAVITETLRLYAPIVRFDRLCENDYRLTDQLIVPKGTAVCVPVYAIHYDPENYENPEAFIPERFLTNNKIDIDPLIYLPFGYGPRNCIGMRFAMWEMKLIIANLLRNFKFEPSATTEPMPLEIENSPTAMKPKRPIRLKFIPRKN